MAIPNPEFDPAKREGKGNRKFFLFATSIAFGSAEEFVKRGVILQFEEHPLFHNSIIFKFKVHRTDFNDFRYNFGFLGI
ncbi:MAG: hypothetical protein N2V75_10235 [Methanophagales archaeon]|nr:hypothetical protein [Methanophagales archaeon]